jgi:hypothetical protein
MSIKRRLEIATEEINSARDEVNEFEDKSYPIFTAEYSLTNANKEIGEIDLGRVLGYRETNKPTRPIFDDHLDSALKNIDEAIKRINDRVTSVPATQVDEFRQASRSARNSLRTARRELRLAGMTGLRLFLNSRASIISLLIAAIAAAAIYFIVVGFHAVSPDAQSNHSLAQAITKVPAVLGEAAQAHDPISRVTDTIKKLTDLFSSLPALFAAVGGAFALFQRRLRN